MHQDTYGAAVGYRGDVRERYSRDRAPFPCTRNEDGAQKKKELAKMVAPKEAPAPTLLNHASIREHYFLLLHEPPDYSSPHFQHQRSLLAQVCRGDARTMS